jgi:hypothetical protein
MQDGDNWRQKHDITFIVLAAYNDIQAKCHCCVDVLDSIFCS